MANGLISFNYFYFFAFLKSKRILFFLFFFSVSFLSFAQQYPWWTHYKSNQMAINPAFCGTKRIVDFRLNYRNQWTGNEGAPKTYLLLANTRLLKGNLGLGGFIFNDKIGPFITSYSSLTLAYHLKFPDSEISVGIQGNYMKRKFNGSEITLRNQQDRAINQYILDNEATFDASLGILYYNDRFHVGLGANNFIESSIEYYKNDTAKISKFLNKAHYSFSAGYNFSDNPDFSFENTFNTYLILGTPVFFDYTLRMHIKKKIIAGCSLRFGDAVALLLGFTLQDQIQIMYSYDFVTSPLRKYQSGTHEISLVFSSNLRLDINKRSKSRFLKQKFQYLL
ncbi:MAG: type IX secretion system membrane protein PorP/SprF [Bacteroidota bacterium]